MSAFAWFLVITGFLLLLYILRMAYQFVRVFDFRIVKITRKNRPAPFYVVEKRCGFWWIPSELEEDRKEFDSVEAAEAYLNEQGKAKKEED